LLASEEKVQRAEAKAVELTAALEKESMKCRILEEKLGKQTAKSENLAHQLVLEKRSSKKW